MRLRDKGLWLAALLLWPVSGASTQDDSAAAARVRALLDEIQLKSVLEGVPAALAQDIRDRRELSDADRAVLGPAIAANFAEQRLYDAILGEMVSRYDAAAVDSALEFYRSPLGKKVKTAESRALRNKARMEQYAKTAELYGASPERTALAQRYDQATQASEDSARILLSVARAAIDGVRQLMPADQRSTADQVEAHLDKMRSELERAVKRRTQFQILYMHGTIMLDELEQYVAFTETPAGQWLHVGLGQALEKVLAESTSAFVADVAAASPSTS